jgi:hypothetical protein
MFARIKESRQTEYLQIVEKYREGGKVRQRMVLFVGHYRDLDDTLERIPNEIKQLRRGATELEKTYEARYVRSAWPMDKHGEELRHRAEHKRRDAGELASRREVLTRLLEEHPDILERDRERAVRHARREGAHFAKRLEARRRGWASLL